MIVIIDYGMGNLRSIANMLSTVGGHATISAARADIERAQKLILPGVGAFDNAVKNLNQLGLTELLEEKVLVHKVPILGICLGMQLFTKGSEEGSLPGLGWISAETRRFNFGDNPQRLRVPNMGWHLVKPKRDCILFAEFTQTPRFYFVHSYHCFCHDPQDVLATSHYGYEFCCAINRANIWGTQFHPEKSHSFGKRVLRNFVGLNSASK